MATARDRTIQTSETCRLCGGVAVLRARIGSGVYFQCEQCRLIQQSRGELPTPAAERAQYELHENHPGDPGYRRFLFRLAGPLFERLEPGAEGLDVGCGPEPVMAMMFREKGFPATNFDPLFFPDETPLSRRYDFVTCSETAEHFHYPGPAFDRLAGLLRPGGWLGVMTEFREPDRDFDGWWYHRDPTHVCFYEFATMEWIAARHGLGIERPSRTVVLFRRPERVRK